MELSGRHLETLSSDKKQRSAVSGIEEAVKTMGGDKIAEETVRREEGQGQNTQRVARKDNGGDHRGVGRVVGDTEKQDK